MTPIISPSLLAADFGNLARDVEMLNRSSADWMHLDVMDGVFVPQHIVRLSRYASHCKRSQETA